ncbi:ZF-HD_dimer domain-containing protein [Cephalotus follicularis]|uniref:ZF-HD_dimer domain-containing protein n=1 Tax=Cephalotus follicularis TaxID=3775 RepID=A0A1Q3BFV7_CEPFO|nr:ZF-HD_dimer domain-containing protein [Cephalotus follicularis]
MEFEEHEDQEEEMVMTVAPGYESLSNSVRPKMGTTSGEVGSTAARRSGATIRYRECLKNHAVSIGGHAVDGCCEFMAAGEEGTLDALKCAACNCHRNFHRKETDGGGSEGIYPHPHQHPHQFTPYYRAPPPAGYLHLAPQAQHRPLPLPAASGGVGVGCYSREDEDMSNPSSSGGGGGGGGSGSVGLKKRFRTKFTPEQKDKMLGFAEQLGWRIQKHDESAVEQFCTETGVERRVLKVWMHNNKHTLG